MKNVSLFRGFSLPLKSYGGRIIPHTDGEEIQVQPAEADGAVV